VGTLYIYGCADRVVSLRRGTLGGEVDTVRRLQLHLESGYQVESDCVAHEGELAGGNTGGIMVEVLVDDLEADVSATAIEACAFHSILTSFAVLPISEKAVRGYQFSVSQRRTKLALLFVPGIGARKTLGTGILTSIEDIMKGGGAVL